MRKKAYVPEGWEIKGSRAIPTLWRKVDLETQRWRGKGPYEELVHPAAAMMRSWLPLLMKTMSESVILLQLRSVSTTHARVIIESHADVHDLGCCLKSCGFSSSLLSWYRPSPTAVQQSRHN